MERGFEFVKIGITIPKDAKLPTRATNGSAGYDFYSPYSFSIPPHEMVVVGTYVKCKLQKDEALLIIPRSSLGIKKGITLANGTALIDSDFYGNKKDDGHIRIALYNRTDEDVSIDRGERVAQGIFLKVLKADNDVVVSGERTGGIGSTGT